MLLGTKHLQFLLASATVQAIPFGSPNINSTAIQWGPCNSTIVSPLPIECANFTVPLDYTDRASNSTLNLELLKVPAVNGPSRGSILFNFGGPGIEVRNSLAEDAHIMQAVTGGFYDLIGFDPRGTANTLTFSCYNSSAERVAASAGANGGAGNSSDVALGRNWAGGSIISETCFTNPDSRSKGGLINTAFVARDLMQLVDALGEDGLLRYWGFSYGTALGATVVAMFPDRVDKVILDGVLNPHEYYHWADVEALTDTDATFSGFLRECLQAGEKCALAQNNMTATELETAIYDLMYDIKFNPIPFLGSLIDYNTMKSIIRPSLYSVSRWGPFAGTLNGLLTKNLTQFSDSATDLLATFPPIFSTGTGDDSAYGIHCSDKAWRANSLDEALPAIEALSKQSRLVGDVFSTLLSICGQWKMEPRERYNGDFNVRTRNPVLVIGNTYDPATSIASAFNVSSGFENSVVLRHNGYGHCTSGQPSICTSRAIQRYFMDGVLPEPGTVCEVDVPPFSNITYTDLLPALGFNMSRVSEVKKRNVVRSFPLV